MYIGIDLKVIVISNSFLSRYVFSIIKLLIIRVIILRVIILGGIIVRFNECKLCFKYDFDFMLNNEDVCQIDIGNSIIKVIVLIFIIYKNIEKRKVI